MVRFVGLCMVGPGKTTSSIGIRFHKDANADDVDALVASCVMKTFGTCILMRGRGLRVESNLFATSTIAVHISDWPDNPDQVDPMHAPPWGSRAYFISANRVHTCSWFVKNSGPDSHPLWGLMLTDNLMDIGDRLFEGACRASVIANNVVCHADHDCLRFIDKCWETTITGNVLSGAWGGDTPSFGIWFSCSVVDVTVSNNVISHTGKDAIVFSEGPHQDIAIVGNTIRNIALDGTSVASRGAIRFGGSADRVTITGNSLRVQTNGVLYGVLCWNGGTLDNSMIVGNTTNADNGVYKPASIGPGTKVYQ